MHCVDRMKRSGRVYPPHDQTAELLAVTPLAGFQSKTGSAFTHSPNGELAPCMCVRPAVSHSPANRAGRLFVSLYHARTMGITESKLRDQDGTPLKFKDASPTEGGISHASPLAGRNACST